MFILNMKKDNKNLLGVAVELDSVLEPADVCGRPPSLRARGVAPQTDDVTLVHLKRPDHVDPRCHHTIGLGLGLDDVTRVYLKRPDHIDPFCHHKAMFRHALVTWG